MAENFADMSNGEFTAALGSAAAVPGGGGAAALLGALAASLCAMSANLTAGRKKFEAVKAQAQEAADRAEELRQKFLELLDKDAQAFIPLSKAYSVENSNPARERILRDASIAACGAALEMLRCCCSSTELLENMLEIGNPMLVSDVGCGAAACSACMKAAAMNVLVNTAGLKEDAEARSINEEVWEVLKCFIPRLDCITDTVMARLEE